MVSLPRIVDDVIEVKWEQLNINARGFEIGCLILSCPHTFGYILYIMQWFLISWCALFSGELVLLSVPIMTGYLDCILSFVSYLDINICHMNKSNTKC